MRMSAMMKPALFALPFLALPALAGDLAAPGSFAGIEDEGARAAAIFTEMGKVLQHPRCLNCHPVDGSPRQGDDLALHQPPVVRGGPAGFGAPGMRCITCHGAENVAYVGAEGLCCTNRARDSSRESSMVAGFHEQTDTPKLQDQELVGLQ
tara:strand:+ start:7674 stop:8126 length:453 start_codon:yes stop_codon:yes gene_type:complete